jgi:hypothetical protein
MSSHALGRTAPLRTDVILPSRGRKTAPVTRFFQVVVLLALIPFVVFYLLPRVYNLVATPYRLDKAVVYADRYNPRLMGIARVEQARTLPAFTALDQMDAAVTRVRAVDAHSAQQLSVLIGQIRADLQPILGSAVVNVGGLVTSLNALGNQLSALNPPASGAADAVTADRATLAAILANAKATAAKVHQARLEADSSARNVSGK